MKVWGSNSNNTGTLKRIFNNINCFNGRNIKVIKNNCAPLTISVLAGAAFFWVGNNKYSHSLGGRRIELGLASLGISLILFILLKKIFKNPPQQPTSLTPQQPTYPTSFSASSSIPPFISEESKYQSFSPSNSSSSSSATVQPDGSSNNKKNKFLRKPSLKPIQIPVPPRLLSTPTPQSLSLSSTPPVSEGPTPQPQPPISSSLPPSNSSSSSTTTEARLDAAERNIEEIKNAVQTIGAGGNGLASGFSRNQGPIVSENHRLNDATINYRSSLLLDD